MKNVLFGGLLLVSQLAFSEQSVVTGKIVKVVPAKKEIYVKDDAGKKHEYYFGATTEIMKDGKKADFTELKVDEKVSVTAEKIGKRLDPKKVEILK